MNYLNRFLIEENTQFECVGVVDCDFRRQHDEKLLHKKFSRSIKENLEKSFKRILNCSNSDYIGHLVFSGDFSTYDTIHYKYHSFIPQIQGFDFLMTFTASERLECVQQEQYEKFCTDGQITSFLRSRIDFSEKAERIFTVKRDEQITDISVSDYHSERDFHQFHESFGVNITESDYYESEHEFHRIHKSFGDDIDDFYDCIKKKEVTCKNGRELDIRELEYLLAWDLSYILREQLAVKTFHLSMLSESEELEMFSKVSNFYHDTRYKIFDNFKNETTLSNYMQNYALSLCARKTCYHDYSQKMIWDIDDVAPWQPKNFQDFFNWYHPYDDWYHPPEPVVFTENDLQNFDIERRLRTPVVRRQRLRGVYNLRRLSNILSSDSD